MQVGCTNLSEEELENLLAVLAETPASEACPDAETSSSLPWLEIPIEVFCVLLLRLVHRDQAYRRTCAGLEVLRLRLESLTAPASRTLVLSIVQAGKSMQMCWQKTYLPLFIPGVCHLHNFFDCMGSNMYKACQQ